MIAKLVCDKQKYIKVKGLYLDQIVHMALVSDSFESVSLPKESPVRLLSACINQGQVRLTGEVSDVLLYGSHQA